MRLHHSLTLALLATTLIARPAAAGLFGPDVELLSPPQVGERLRNEALSFNAGGAALHIHSKGAAIGGFFVGMVLSSAMASSGGGNVQNAAQMQRQVQANMDIAQQANLHIQGAVRDLSAAAAGAETAERAQRGPLPLLAKSLNQALLENQTQLIAAGAGPAPALQLKLLQREWKLDFEMLSSDYSLKTALTLELLDKSADKIHLRNTCAYQHTKKMPLEDWQRDEQQAIAQAAEEIALRCHEEFARALNLAQAIPATSAPPLPETAAPPDPASEVALPTDTPPAQ
ncbi:MAG: hypothetical protein KKF85_15260 [Gammaproteobacteria bacterium]|nr:hypothetical protein [Rhodocyclaceae bacterium]MBU3909808.1 hypothetical protein [Gammaproteobacteria bacterium]MBU3988658.1 hypothetical protein [Gammaproteobacteria bacterium]MBU4003918.1 hypothetical protein [Gammaproteobacteria bacterium]MBU4097824.1 hypothetical protein [Gammaproteobacteria bacterium]